jgi:NAD(P)-dependent dehydrogenase (short-subunit alcohol dehydrogenase family)
MLLENKVAIVTGAGRGIGRAIARSFAEEGAAVVVAARTENEIRQVASEIEGSGGHAAAVVADVGREPDCEKIVQAARRAFGTVDILVNNAATYGPVQPVEKISAREWDEVMAVNLRSAFLLSALVLPEMCKRRSGTILNITSAAAKSAFSLNGPYAASKAALIALTRTLAAEAGEKGVRVNALSPGPVPDTKMSAELRRGLASIQNTDEKVILEQMSQRTLLRRAQTPQEIASAAVFLVSDQASAITGQTVNADGGVVFY